MSLTSLFIPYLHLTCLLLLLTKNTYLMKNRKRMIPEMLSLRRQRHALTISKAVYWEKKAERLKEDKESLEEIVRDKDRVIQGKEREVVEARKERERKVDDWRREVKKRKTEAEEVKKRNNGLHERIAGYQHQIHTLKSRLTRAPEQLATVTRRIACMFNAKTDHDRKFYLKEHGTIPDNTPNVLLDLVAMDKVPANKIIESLKNAKGVTISGDGTMHKDETYEMKHAAVIDESNSKLQFFLGLKMATNHTSEEQLDGWIKTVEDLFHLLFESGLCTKDDAQIFWNLVTGFHSDHAADQKKLFHLLKEWKKKSDHDLNTKPGVTQIETDQKRWIVQEEHKRVASTVDDSMGTARLPHVHK
ncbi:hypothetical protein F5890DRAFT_1478483 [Lentinula detonsa]|uniref:Uncharacterized protein n=1 Tax=Lentinula detonsa TaxID=2804962 RepID=A0AA38UMI5_9AGAR|nr:hypothetical protein F5890DRAFT_1478483 [Lentinula detonsa]